jgi:hypothetical protein
MNKMKTFNYFSIICAVLLICAISGCAEYPQHEMTDQIFVDKSSINMYVGDETQVWASPADVAFKWTSDNEQIATVTQTGLVKATGEGLATLSIEYGGYETKKVDVRNRIFVPITGVRVLADSVELMLGESTQVWVYPVPENASEVPKATWRSENPTIATVDQDGVIMAVWWGTTNVVVSLIQKDGSIFEKSIKVKVQGYVELERSRWTSTQSHARPSDSPSPVGHLDGDISTFLSLCKPGKSTGGASTPAGDRVFFIIDMKEIQEFNSFRIRHRNELVGLRVWALSMYGSNDGVNYSEIQPTISIPYVKDSDVLETPNIEIPRSRYRYLKVFFDDWDNVNNSAMQMSEFYLRVKM